MLTALRVMLWVRSVSLVFVDHQSGSCLCVRERRVTDVAAGKPVPAHGLFQIRIANVEACTDP